MEPTSSLQTWLEMLPEPAFLAQDEKILAVNTAAKQLLLSPGDSVTPLLQAGREDYAAFTCGCICLEVTLLGHSWSAAITRMEGANLFRLEGMQEDSPLRSYALAARSLRLPLATVMHASSALFASLAEKASHKKQRQMARINQGLYQILRQVSNMSDAYLYTSSPQHGMELGNLVSVVQEILEGCQTALRATGRDLTYTLPQEQALTRLNRSLLERAVCNLLSNALKFSPTGSCLQFSLQRQGDLARLILWDPEAVFTGEMLSSIHRRYTRCPVLEDPKQGTGLGLVLARCAATAHGGSLLLAPDNRGGTRYCLSIRLQCAAGEPLLRDHFQLDYAGHYDHILLELSDILPLELYTPKIVND